MTHNHLCVRCGRVLETVMDSCHARDARHGICYDCGNRNDGWPGLLPAARASLKQVLLHALTHGRTLEMWVDEHNLLHIREE